ncbi:MAG: alpha/beta hydrolase family protein [Phycisphaeraceae bacterium]
MAKRSKATKASKATTVTAAADYSPSLVHLPWMDEHPPALSYQDGDVKAWQAKVRRTVVAALGLKNMPARKCALDARTLWRSEVEHGVIEKLVFTAELGAEVPAYLCLPRKGKAPYPVFICLQGHSTGMHNSIGVTAEDESLPKQIEGDRDFALGCMERGIAALCIEQRAFGERREQHIGSEVGRHLTCYQATVNALIIGRTLIGERVYDVDRAIDLLAERQRSEKLFDLSRLGVMGNSGGGTVTLFAAGVLPRLRYAMPSCYFCTFRDSLVAINHCVCNTVPGLRRHVEMADVLGLFAPRPVVVVAGKTDPIFPLAGVKRGFKQLQAIYAAAGAADKCKLVIGSQGHRFYAAPAWKAMLPLLR